MTTIIRSDSALKNPLPGRLLLPSLGVSNIVHRWHAEAARGAGINGEITSIGDAAGDAHLTLVEGSVILRQVNNRRYIDLGAGNAARNRIGGPGGEAPDLFTMAALIYFEPSWDIGGAGAAVFATQDGNSHAIGIAPSDGKATAYAGGTILSSAANSAGWHSVLATYSKTGAESISVDNGETVQAEVHGNYAPWTAFGLQGRPALKVRFIDAAIITGALTSAQRTAVHKGLLAQRP